MELIDKDALVAEIDGRIKKYILLQQKPEMSDLREELQNKIDCLNSIKGYIINTLKVKDDDLDLEKEIIRVSKNEYFDFTDWKSIARHFYKFGLNANNNSVIEKACEWLKNNVTYTHPRTGETKCVVNLNAFIDAMKR